MEHKSGLPSQHPGEVLDPLLALRGSGKQLWADEHADVYVRRLRERLEMWDQLGPNGYSDTKESSAG